MYKILTYEPYKIAENNNSTSQAYIPIDKRDSMFIACGRTKYVWFDEYDRAWPIYMSACYRYCSVTKPCGPKGRESMRIYKLPQGVYDELYPEYEHLMEERIKEDIRKILRRHKTDVTDDSLKSVERVQSSRSSKSSRTFYYKLLSEAHN